MKPGSGLNGQGPEKGSESLGKGRIMSLGWGSVPSMCPTQLHILSGSQAQANFSHLGFPWQLWSEAVEHLGKQEAKKWVALGLLA